MTKIVHLCPKCIEINCKLRQCYLDKGFRVNICLGDIVMDKMDRTPKEIGEFFDDIDKTHSATCTNPNTSACNTCLSVSCQCCEDNNEEDLFEYHLPSEAWGDSKLNDEEDSYELSVTVDVGILWNKIQDGFLYVCVLFSQTINKVCDKVVDRFKKAYKEGKL